MSVPNSALAALKKYQNAFRLTETGMIERPTVVNTPTGTTKAYSVIAAGIGVGLASGQGGENQQENLIANRFGQMVTWYLLFSAGTDVAISDRVTLTTGRKFEVVAVPNKGISYESLRRVIAVELV